ncbi:MAG: hypothetical protein JWL89_347 [Candidatus Saccharibacteria bacterium]|jgi:hypothetical protein|nr:hypothetical protein [Candidatus Saccharibacteria bacterium]
MSEITKRPPAERDLFSLAGDSFPELVEAFDAALALSPEEREKVDHPCVPPRMIQLGNILVSNTVRLIRSGTQAELGEAARVMSQSILRTMKRNPDNNLGSPYDEACRLHSAAAVVLTDAVSPASAEGGYSVVRSQDGIAAKLLCAIADTPDAWLARENLYEVTDVNAEEAHRWLIALETGGLVVGLWFGKTKRYYLGPCADPNHGTGPEILALARYHAERYDAAHSEKP